jgi:hypothetical protein
MLYEVALYEPNPYERCHEVTRRFTVGSLRAAELAAESLLKPHTRYETDYSARVNRHPYVTSQPKGSEWQARVTYEPELHYVPSVGELGYW